MTESPPSGYTPDYDAYGYDAYSTGAYQTVATAFADDATGTYGYIPQQAQQYETYDPNQQQAPTPPQQQTYGYETGYGYSGYDSAGYDQTGTYAAYDLYAYGETTAATAAAPGGAGTYYDTGTYDTSALWQNGQPAQQQGTQGQSQAQQQTPYAQADWDSGAYPTYGYGYGYGYDSSGDTGIYEQVRPVGQPAYEPERGAQPGSEAAAADAVVDGADAGGQLVDDLEMFTAEFAAVGDTEPERHDYAADGEGYGPDGYGDGEPVARSRRRKPAKRSALLTVAVPSVAVMGVAAVGAAAVAGVGMAQDAPKAQADGQKAGTANAPTTQLDRQLAGVSRDASDFAERASRSQERIDLKDRQEAAKRAAQAAAARKEALRPKFLLPVTQKGLSAYFGQAGVNWMALHTGIDFPVQVGTPVMAATDGTVRTQWNSSYGNMAIVTAPDGTETWYCHLSSTKIRSGKVKAGDVIAYSGNTGNTTGPHLHFEVRPNGGAPIDPLPWLLAHGLDPR
ncbi:Peptidase family M23 [Streptomyces sp. DvalAA-14]|uniref:M23 family metallopeptidase n=1 Tax=unclassified Streptomyces TaxID=2593676 RepID=UPI00081B5889|nr:M23 family metallopeptidase [Streptomyces sp. DvalAA-14]SCE29635.1 Peptidase family M23 [Streptomyces sp. DvalAA-14]